MTTVAEEEDLCDEPTATPASTASDSLICFEWLVAHEQGVAESATNYYRK